MTDFNSMVLAKEQILFQELIQSVCAEREINTYLFDGLTESEWISLIELSTQQSVSAIIADKILELPSRFLPPRNLIFSLLRAIGEVEKRNLKIHETTKYILNTYAQKNIYPILVKGEAVAQYWPKPQLRSMGDIDLFFTNEEEYDTINNWIISQGHTYHVDDREGHWAYEINNVMVEHHKRLAFFEKNKYNRKFSELINTEINSNSILNIKMGDIKAKTLPVEINAFYIFLHLFFHFIHEGISVRQLMDWTFFLKEHKHVIREGKLADIAQSFNLIKAMQLIAQSALKYLEIPSWVFPFDLGKKNENIIDKIWEDILQGGNFGFYNKEYEEGLNPFKRKSIKYLRLLKKTYIFREIAPHYSYIIPVHSLKDFVNKTVAHR